MVRTTRGSVLLTGVALAALVAAAIWVLAAPDGESSGEVGAPAPISPETSATPVEAAPKTVALWDPADGSWTEVHWGQDPTDAELSPDGRWLVYASEESDGTPQIYVRGPSGIKQLTFHEGGSSEPTWSPDGKQIAFSTSVDPAGDAQIYVMNARGGHLRLLFGTSREDGHPDWSPDGSRIVFHSRSDDSGYDVYPGGQIFVGSLRTRAVIPLTRPHATWWRIDPEWSPDGRWITYGSFFRSTLNGQPYGSVEEAEIWTMRADGTDKRPLDLPARWHPHDPTWSPDGRFIAFERDGGTVSITDPRTGLAIEAFSTAISYAGPSWSRDGILMTLTADPPTPTNPDPQFEARLGIDATIVMAEGTCEVEERHGSVAPGPLWLEFVNASRHDGAFTLLHMAPRETVADLRADIGTWSRPRRYVDSREVATWFTRGDTAADRWVVTCWKDVYPQENTIFMKVVGVVVAKVRDGAVST